MEELGLNPFFEYFPFALSLTLFLNTEVFIDLFLNSLLLYGLHQLFYMNNNIVYVSSNPTGKPKLILCESKVQI